MSKNNRFIPNLERLDSRCLPSSVGSLPVGLPPLGLLGGLGATVGSLAPAVAQLPATVVQLGSTVTSLAPVVAQLPTTVVLLGDTVASL